MKEINFEGVNWVVDANAGLTEDEFVNCHIGTVGIYMHLEGANREKALREAYRLMFPPKKEDKPKGK